MRYRQQSSLETFSHTSCSLVRLADNADVLPRTFRTFTTLQQAVSYMARMDEERSPKLRKSTYGSDPRDVRYVVNFYGSPKRERTRLAPPRVIMSCGIVFNRLLPVALQS